MCHKSLEKEDCRSRIRSKNIFLEIRTFDSRHSHHKRLCRVRYEGQDLRLCHEVRAGVVPVQQQAVHHRSQCSCGLVGQRHTPTTRCQLAVGGERILAGGNSRNSSTCSRKDAKDYGESGAQVELTAKDNDIVLYGARKVLVEWQCATELDGRDAEPSGEPPRSGQVGDT